MNRPYWLDLRYLAAFFLPPTLVAAAGTAAISKLFDLPDWVAALIYFVTIVLAISLWLVGLVLWARFRSGNGGK